MNLANIRAKHARRKDKIKRRTAATEAALAEARAKLPPGQQLSNDAMIALKDSVRAKLDKEAEEEERVAREEARRFLARHQEEERAREEERFNAYLEAQEEERKAHARRSKVAATKRAAPVDDDKTKEEQYEGRLSAAFFHNPFHNRYAAALGPPASAKRGKEAPLQDEDGDEEQEEEYPPYPFIKEELQSGDEEEEKNTQMTHDESQGLFPLFDIRGMAALLRAGQSQMLNPFALEQDYFGQKKQATVPYSMQPRSPLMLVKNEPRDEYEQDQTVLDPFDLSNQAFPGYDPQNPYCLQLPYARPPGNRLTAVKTEPREEDELDQVLRDPYDLRDPYQAFKEEDFDEDEFQAPQQQPYSLVKEEDDNARYQDYDPHPWLQNQIYFSQQQIAELQRYAALYPPPRNGDEEEQQQMYNPIGLALPPPAMPLSFANPPPQRGGRQTNEFDVRRVKEEPLD